MKKMMAAVMVAVVLAAGTMSAAEPPKMKMTTEIPEGISTPDKVETRVGNFDLRDGIPSKESIENVYDYLAFEDMKPAGCEPMELRSGGRWAGGLCPHLELRDEKVVFLQEINDPLRIEKFHRIEKSLHPVEEGK